MLELINVGKSYELPDARGRQIVLRDINLTVQPGESISIVGPSGSGKSTLLNIIGALDKPTSGRVLLDGDDLTVLADGELAGIRNSKIGFIFQLHYLLGQCTVLENVLIPSLAARGADNGKAVRERALDLLERVNLKEYVNYRPAELSGGQRQRAAVVRALINRPALLLADEPTGSLDRKSAEDVFDLLIELNKTEKVTLIVVTHSIALAKRCGRPMLLSEGVLKDGGSVE